MKKAITKTAKLYAFRLFEHQLKFLPMTQKERDEQLKIQAKGLGLETTPKP